MKIQHCGIYVHIGILIYLSPFGSIKKIKIILDRYTTLLYILTMREKKQHNQGGNEMELNAKNTKETINSLCLSLHNHRSITFETSEASGRQTGKIIKMNNTSFKIDTKPNWWWEYADITKITMN